MYCKYCGAKVPEDSVFCQACGKKIAEPQPEPVTAVSEEAAVWEEKPKSTAAKAWGIVGGIVLVLAAVLVCAWVLVVQPMMENAGRNEMTPGRDNEVLVGCWVAESDTSALRHYYEFAEDGTGYTCNVGYDQDTWSYVYREGTDVELITAWSFSRDYGLECQWTDDDGDLVTVRYAETGEEGFDFRYISSDHFRVTLWSQEWDFFRLPESVLPSSARLQAD